MDHTACRHGAKWTGYDGSSPNEGFFAKTRQPAVQPYNSDVRNAPRSRNWQTHYFEVVAPQGVEVRVLSWALRRGIICSRLQARPAARWTSLLVRSATSVLSS